MTSIPMTAIHPAMPQNVEAEAFLLGALLFDNSLLAEVDGFLRAEHFFDPVHSRIFGVISGCVQSGQLADPVVLKAHFASEGTLDELGGEAYLRELVCSVPTALHAADYGRSIFEAAQRRRLIEVSRSLAGHAYAEANLNADATLDHAFEMLSEFADGAKLRPSVLSLHEAMQQSLADIEAAHKAGGAIRGVPTGLLHLDRTLNGLRPGRLIVLAAKTSTGKSAMATQIALHAASNSGRVLLFSLEMTAIELAERMIASGAGLDSRLLARGKVSAAQFDAAADYARAVTETPLFIDQTAQAHFGRLVTRIRMAARRHDLKLVVIDYLQKVQVDFRVGRNRVHEIEHVTSTLKGLAIELNIPILALSQLSREGAKRQNPCPILADLRDSGAIEQDADQVVFLWRNPEDEQQELASGATTRLVTATVAKNRNGNLGNLSLLFDCPTTTFREACQDYTRTI